MNTVRRKLILLVMLVTAICCRQVAADTELLLVNVAGASIPAGTSNPVAGSTAASQFVIPRYRVGTSYPAGQILGWGPQSLLTGTADTASLPLATRALVITEGFAEDMSQWQTTSAGKTAAVLQPVLTNVTIAGYSTNNWASGGAVNDVPHVQNKLTADSYDGFRGRAGGGRIENVGLFYIPGTACYTQRNATSLGGPYQPFDRVKWNLRDLNIRRVFRGLYMNALDSCVENVEVEAFRDYGLRLGTFGGVGAIQFARLHAYGGGMSAADNTALDDLYPNVSGLRSLDSPGIWIDGDTCHGVDCYSENVPVGLYVKGGHAALDGFYSHTCSVANILFAGSHGHVSKARLDVLTGTIGAKFAQQYNTLTDSTVTVAGTGKAVVLTNGTNQVLRNITIDSFGNASGVGIDADATLTNCTIVAHIAGGSVGLDVDDGGVSRIGEGNVLWITSSNGTTTPADLPDTWTTTPTTTTNDVRVNGTRYYPP